MKTYEEFLDYVKNNIKDYLPPEYAGSIVEIVKVTKDNDMVLDGLIIREEKNGGCPTVYLEQYYGEEVSGTDETKIMEKIAADYQAAVEYYAKLKDLDVSDWNNVQGKVGYYLVNKDLNRERLKDKVFMTIGDLAKVYIVIANFWTKGFNYTLIPQDILSEWGVSEDELDKAAEANMAVRFPAVLLSIDEYFRENATGRPAANLFRRGRKTDSDIMYVLTNRSRLNGATVMMYPGILQKIRDALGKDYYIIPSSVDDVMIVPKKSDIRGYVLEEILRERNVIMPRNKILSNNVYEYIEESRSIKQVAKQ